MNTQNQIKRCLSQPESVEHVCTLLDDDEFSSRSELARFLCEQFDFYDERGNLQLGGCLRALREIERSGRFVLPEVQRQHARGSPKRLRQAVAPPVSVPMKAGDIVDLHLVPVGSEEQMRIWNELMIREHPRAAGPLVGRQLRYLVGSQHGWLGGLGFASAALQLADREEWIGWNVEQRRENLHAVVCLSRFLIRPGITCRNLGSRVLGLSMSVLPKDFEQRYGYRPLLVESFVDMSQHLGTCYKAANWIRIGYTQGRGRQDRLREGNETKKEIYVYPLVKGFRDQLGLAPESGLGPLKPVEGLSSTHWSEKEFGNAPLGDARLSKRLVEIAGLKAENPGQKLTSAAGGEWATVKGYYRFVDKPHDSAVDMESILHPHRQRTMRRMQGQRIALCVQDGTDLNYSSLSQCEGLGIIGTNQSGKKSRGMHLHSTLTLSTDGLPLGVLRADCIARKPKAGKRNRHSLPIEEKDTFCWVEGLRDIISVSEAMPHTRLVCVCDREADIFEMFDECRHVRGVDLLIRARHNRMVTAGVEGVDTFKLFSMIRDSSPRGEVEIRVPRQSARVKHGKQKPRTLRAERTATLTLRYMPVRFQPSQYQKQKEPIEAWVMHALETPAPEHEEPIEWFLLTTIEITSVEQVIECLRWYCYRWRIEDWHRVLKTGLRIEEYAHRSAERLRRAIAIDLVVAWRIMLMTLLGRGGEELPAEVLFTDIEVEVLNAYAKKKRQRSFLHLSGAVEQVARMGGYLARTHDPPPGHQLMWRGYLHLQRLCEGFALRES